MKVIILLTLGFILCSGPTRADPPPATPNANDRPLPQVTVQSQREQIEHQAYEFVRKATRNPQFRDESLPRWNAPLCFAVAGLPTEQGLFALGRLGDVARAAGAKVAPRGCKYNFYVVFMAHPDAPLQKAFHRNPKAFDKCDGVPAVREFLTPSKPRAVRVWHNVKAFGSDGMPMGASGICSGVVVDQKDLPVNLQYFASRIERYDVIAFTLALVIVDTAYPQPLKLGQLVDYAAMAGLADIAADADLGDTPTVLRLFDEPPDQQPAGLTSWDEAFLGALYQTNQASRTQTSQIAVKMTQAIVH
ncbi:MAG: hypothetical protein JSR66_32140 [Proteobacteria bacterium]|nr:hypothetical protein [Pseudomonadota bacterium]